MAIPFISKYFKPKAESTNGLGAVSGLSPQALAKPEVVEKTTAPTVVAPHFRTASAAKDCLWNYHNIHKGKTALAMATGPSLALSGVLKSLKSGVVTFGVNDISNYYDPNYLIAFDSMEPTKQLYEPWKNSKATKFLCRNRDHEGLEIVPIWVCKNTSIGDWWWSTPEATWFLASVSSALLPVQLAAFMGCSRIALIGADFGSYNGFDKAGEVGTKEPTGEGYQVSYKFSSFRDKEILRLLSSKVLEHLEQNLKIEIVDASYGSILAFKKLDADKLVNWLLK